MTPFWRRELIKLVLFAAIAFFIDAVEGPIPALVFLGLALFLANLHHVRHLGALVAWLPEADSATVPAGSGSWEQPFSMLYRLLRRRQQNQEQLNEALNRFQQASAAMPDGIIILDTHDDIQWCNPNAERHFGLQLDKDRGSQLTYLVRQPEFLEYLEEGSPSEPLILRGGRNSDLVLSVQVVPYGDDRKLVISRDITQWERAETARRDFVANVSHELRTPITVISGFIETLTELEKANPDIVKRSLALMREQSNRMQRLVEDLLTLSHLESGPPIERDAMLDMQSTVASLVSEAESLSGGRHRIRVEAVADQNLLGAPMELRSAFANLVTNAVRYTPAGGEVRLSWRVHGGHGYFAVQDTGPGIAPEHLPRLTERFYRVDRGRSRESGGTGLGLAIVKHVLNRHHARLEITSVVGAGSTFTAVFPAARLAPPAVLAPSMQAAGELSKQI